MTATAIRRWSGPALVGLALAGTAIAVYLAAVKLSGGAPACVLVGGCDTVNSSVYAEFIGLPVALFGAGASALIALAALAWWRTGSRRALLVAYLVGLSALPVLAYLTYVELFVIRAICSWCVAYAVTVVAGWLVATRALLRPAGGP